MDKDCIRMTPWTVQRIMRDMELKPGDPKKLFFDMNCQRNSDMWTTAWKSELIHSLLQGYVIPAVHVIRLGTENIRPMSVIDGKQRITSVREYVSDLFKLSAGTPSVTLYQPNVDEDGLPRYDDHGDVEFVSVTYDIAGKRFSQLPNILKSTLIDSTINVIMYDSVTDDEVAVQMTRLNRQKVFNGVQRANVIVGEKFAKVVDAITKNNFFMHRVQLTESQERVGGLKRIVFQCLLIYTKGECGETIGLTNTNIEKFARDNQLTDATFNSVDRILCDLDTMLPNDIDTVKYMNSINIPVLLMNYDKYEQLADDEEITRKDYVAFLEYWFKTGIEKKAYQDNITREAMNKKYVDGRINVMEDELVKFMARTRTGN